MKLIQFLRKGVYSYDYMGEWEKNQWNMITWKRRFLDTLTDGRYNWCRLNACKNLKKK